jgi:glycolate oxidase FAD binding subunit
MNDESRLRHRKAAVETMSNTNLPETPQTPADAAAVAEAVRAAGEKGLAVYPIGGGTRGGRRRLSANVSANRETLADNHLRPLPGITLSTANMNRLIDYPADDMTVTVEAGMTISELNRLLAEKRQWLPVDVPFPDRATVGGAIATNAGGPRRFAYGAMRDYLLGFTAVDGTGTLFSGGGRVVKNAAGYNMCRLIAGSRGTLGIITQATLMVRPLPEASALLWCEVADFALAEKLLADLVRLPVRPVAIELFAGRQREGEPPLGPLTGGNVARLCAGFEGSSVEVEWMLAKLGEEWTKAGIASMPLPLRGQDDTTWRRMAEFPVDETINVLPSKLVETVSEILKESPDCAIQAHASDGVIHVARAIRGDNLAAASKQRETDDRIAIPPEIRVMRAIKERFDPRNILNPGLVFA